jgi:uncharacterized protein YecE (DUF72 family)
MSGISKPAGERASVIRVGTAGWAIPARVRDRFPETGTGLERYATRFGAVEINSTFYKSHKPQTYARWAAAVPDGFRFSLKLPKAITHDRRLVDVGPLVDRFLDEVVAIGAKLGALLIQLPPSLVFDVSVTRDFLTFLRRRAGGRIVCEPRHASWFDREADRLLSEFDVARVAADPARVPQASLPGGATDLVYYRLHGSPRMYYSEYGQAVVQDLASRLMAQGASETWCMFDNTTSGAAMSDALLLQEQLP